MLKLTKVEELTPESCICGNTKLDKTVPYYIHQVIELPEVEMKVTHFALHKGECPCCGKVNKAFVPKDHPTGFGVRLSVMIAEITGNQGDSWTIVQNFCSSVLGFHISLGGIKKSSTAHQKLSRLTMKPLARKPGRPRSTISMRRVIGEKGNWNGSGLWPAPQLHSL